MKKGKKFIAFLLAAVMILAVTTTAFATTESAGSGEGSITISGALEGETYSIYKIFDATVSGNNVSYTTDASVKAAMEQMDDCPFVFTSQGGDLYYVTLSDTASTEDVIAFLTEYVETLTATASATANSDGLTFTGVEYGYYFVTTTTGSVVSIDTVTGTNKEIEEKNEAPGVEKKVSDDDESYGDSSTASVGDTVYFQVTITASEGATNYVLHDVMSTGLAFGSVTKVTLNGTELVAGTDYTVNSEPTDGCTFEVDFSKLSLSENDVIVVYYTATLTADAINYDNVTNKAQVSYGDNQSTEWDQTTTYTYGFDLVKTDDDKNLLDGAEFTLKDAEGNLISFLYDEDSNTYTVCTADTDGAVTTITVYDGCVRVDGLANGTYTLTETKAPDGYNLLSTSTTVVIADADLNATIEGSAYTSGGVNVVNQAGSTLPSTGGMGTTILYIAGVVLILIAGVALVTKRRMAR